MYIHVTSCLPLSALRSLTQLLSKLLSSEQGRRPLQGHLWEELRSKSHVKWPNDKSAPEVSTAQPAGTQDRHVWWNLQVTVSLSQNYFSLTVNWIIFCGKCSAAAPLWYACVLQRASTLLHCQGLVRYWVNSCFPVFLLLCRVLTSCD